MKNRKTTIKKFILSVAMLAAIYSNANDGFSSITNNELSKTTLTLNDVKTGNQLVIKDLNGIVLYKELIKNSGLYSKGFDLTTLPDGNYVFELEKDLEYKSIPFSVNSGKVVFNNNESTSVFKPLVTSKDNYVYLTKLALNKEPMDIKIYYLESDELIYSEKVKDTQTISKAYKLSLNAKGKYKIVLISDGREYYEYITL
ncbi:hypothetical protein [Yeosuana sp.]|uniref:hypothetical protein n=1 Tax=Yeosuana sp. TaxID=2529388 RepID=UPI004054CF1A|tara:strand:+ start:2238 stop:2837 length:600 start_codon:yes stop_codon:yes gene_type:complete